MGVPSFTGLLSGPALFPQNPPAKKDAKIPIGSNGDAMSPASNDIYCQLREDG
jgi:hypothetical protein